MSTQTEINKNLVQYLQKVGYRDDKIINDLAHETSKLGSVSQMQIAKEQGQFLEIITKISNANSCFEMGRFTGMRTLFIARSLSEKGKIIPSRISGVCTSNQRKLKIAVRRARNIALLSPMKGYVPQQLNTDRRFSGQTTPLVAVSAEDGIMADNQESIDIKT